jgi:hypothetical protein
MSITKEAFQEHTALPKDKAHTAFFWIFIALVVATVVGLIIFGLGLGVSGSFIRPLKDRVQCVYDSSTGHFITEVQPDNGGINDADTVHVPGGVLVVPVQADPKTWKVDPTLSPNPVACRQWIDATKPASSPGG